MFIYIKYACIKLCTSEYVNIFGVKTMNRNGNNNNNQFTDSLELNISRANSRNILHKPQFDISQSMQINSKRLFVAQPQAM